jgi:hypothetical protein
MDATFYWKVYTLEYGRKKMYLRSCLDVHVSTSIHMRGVICCETEPVQHTLIEVNI